MRTIRWAIATVLLFPLLWLRCRLRPAHRPGPVLVVQFGKLGDLLCTTAMLRALAASPFITEVHVLCLERCIPALLGNPSVGRVFAVDGHSRYALLRELRRYGYQAVFNCLPGSFGSMIGLWVGAPHRVNTPSDSHGLIVRLLRFANTVNIPYQTETSTHAHYMDLLVAVGVEPVPYGIDLAVGPKDDDGARQWLDRAGFSDRRFVCIAPSAGNAIKQWPAEKFAALIDHAVSKHGLSTALITRDAALAAEIRRRSAHQGRIIVADDLRLAEIGALCRRAAAYVSVDTGLLYVASAVGCPLVVLLGPISPDEQVPPPGPRVVHVPPPPGCRPWVFVSKTPRAGTEDELRSIRETSVEAAADALDQLLAQSSPLSA